MSAPACVDSDGVHGPPDCCDARKNKRRQWSSRTSQLHGGVLKAMQILRWCDRVDSCVWTRLCVADFPFPVQKPASTDTPHLVGALVVCRSARFNVAHTSSMQSTSGSSHRLSSLSCTVHIPSDQPSCGSVGGCQSLGSDRKCRRQLWCVIPAAVSQVQLARLSWGRSSRATCTAHLVRQSLHRMMSSIKDCRQLCNYWVVWKQASTMLTSFSQFGASAWSTPALFLGEGPGSCESFVAHQQGLEDSIICVESSSKLMYHTCGMNLGRWCQKHHSVFSSRLKTSYCQDQKRRFTFLLANNSIWAHLVSASSEFEINDAGRRHITMMTENDDDDDDDGDNDEEDDEDEHSSTDIPPPSDDDDDGGNPPPEPPPPPPSPPPPTPPPPSPPPPTPPPPSPPPLSPRPPPSPTPSPTPPPSPRPTPTPTPTPPVGDDVPSGLFSLFGEFCSI